MRYLFFEGKIFIENESQKFGAVYLIYGVISNFDGTQVDIFSIGETDKVWFARVQFQSVRS